VKKLMSLRMSEQGRHYLKELGHQMDTTQGETVERALHLLAQSRRVQPPVIVEVTSERDEFWAQRGYSSYFQCGNCGTDFVDSDGKRCPECGATNGS
jgi:rubrerythrin